MYATDFEYDGIKLSDKGLMICSFDSSNPATTVSSGADITFNQVKSSSSDKFNLYSYTYDEAYTTTFQICKDPDTDYTADDWDSTSYLTPDNVADIQRWLCRKNKYYTFRLDQEGYENIHWNATFSSQMITVNGKIAGLELTLVTDAPYAYLDEVVDEFTCIADESFTISVTNKNNATIKPIITIYFSADCDLFTLRNSLDNKIMQIENCLMGETITLDCENGIITTDSSVHDVTIANDFNYYFPRLIIDYDSEDNVFTTNTDCSIIFTYCPTIAVGM